MMFLQFEVMTLHHEVTFHRGDAIAEMKFGKRLAFCVKMAQHG